jgi:outer membrane lipoprotein SlyB
MTFRGLGINPPGILRKEWRVIRFGMFTVSAAMLVLLAGCGPDYSPNTYSASAVQQANKVERGVIIGVRQIEISAAGVVGASTGAAAGGAIGGVAGSQGGGSVTTALGAIGGGLIGGLVGTSVEHAAGDTSAYEYIVRKSNNELVSVTQKDAVPLKIGTKVLVIAGNQARIVPDYTVDLNTQSQAASQVATKPAPDAAGVTGATASTPASSPTPTPAPADATTSAAPSGPASPGPSADTGTSATAPSAGTVPTPAPVAAAPLPAPTTSPPANLQPPAQSSPADARSPADGQ